MTAVRSKNTAPEIKVRRYLHKAGLRYRLHVRTLPGIPDITLPKYRVGIMVHGCFWHQHQSCAKARLPSTNQLFWSEKLSDNVRRDGLIYKALGARGWKVIVAWECEVRNAQRLSQLGFEVRGHR